MGLLQTTILAAIMMLGFVGVLSVAMMRPEPVPARRGRQHRSAGPGWEPSGPTFR
jgi:hypothetical protein